MILDQNLIFSDGQTASFTTSTPSTNVIDLLQGVAENIGVGTIFGADFGIGDGVAMPKVYAVVQTALTTTDSATLSVYFQGSTDSSNWSTYMETPAIAAAQLAVGDVIARMDWPPRAPGVALPRYHRLLYVPATGTFTTGAIFAGIVLQRDDWDLKYYPSGFAVGA